jgi:hypothetical protein
VRALVRLRVRVCVRIRVRVRCTAGDAGASATDDARTGRCARFAKL